MEPIQLSGPFIYISTVSSLTHEPFQVRIKPGAYTLIVQKGGYVFTKAPKVPNGSQIVKVLNERDGDPGFDGTYWSGETNKADILKMVSNYFIQYFSKDITERMDFEECEQINYTEEVKQVLKYENWEKRRPEGVMREHLNVIQYFLGDEGKHDVELIQLHAYNNIPVIFYLDTQLKLNDLAGICLSQHYHDVDKNIIVWKVYHHIKGDLGVAIQQPSFVNMMGDQMGLVMYANIEAYNNSQESLGAIGFGNFEIDDDDVEDKDILYPNYNSEYFVLLAKLFVYGDSLLG